MNRSSAPPPEWASRSAEHRRLYDSELRKADWKKWGPYISNRSWGTVREDYSRDSKVWESFTFDQAHKRTYRWAEDAIAGFCDRQQLLCVAPAFWNGRDHILKERLFGLGGNEGNHGEDVKEYYFETYGLPSHAYMDMLYRYPIDEFPYGELRELTAQQTRHDRETELVTVLEEAFEARRFVDVRVEYAKADQEDIYCRITATNRSRETVPFHVLPHIWLRNDWTWKDVTPRGSLSLVHSGAGAYSVRLEHNDLQDFEWLAYVTDDVESRSDIYFTENESNLAALAGVDNRSQYVKDAVHRAVIHGESRAVNPACRGTKAAAHFEFVLSPGDSICVHTRLRRADSSREGVPVVPVDRDVDDLFVTRRIEADEFYDALSHELTSREDRFIQRSALSGLLWNKQFYHYSAREWLDPSNEPGHPASVVRRRRRNDGWTHLMNFDVVSMPDKWEYPWYAAWDLAFHLLPLALIDPEWARRQQLLMLREWYMHPNGQIPAYEWAYGDVNPPVQAWSAWRVYEILKNHHGIHDKVFLERVFQKLLLNFTWWVNRKDVDGNNVFEGGFLGLDNIGVFDRSRPLPGGGFLEQADGTAWMAMYALNMLRIALELARDNIAYEDLATKFFEHFIHIADAINDPFERDSLWDERDGFYYDSLHFPNGSVQRLRIKSFVGLIPLLAVEVVPAELIENLPRFRRRTEWFLEHRPHLLRHAVVRPPEGSSGNWLLSLVDRERLGRILGVMLDEDRFLAPHGLRSLSKEHADRPFVFYDGRERLTVAYEPAESSSPMFGGNSNWRGPVWLPINYLMIEALRTYHDFFGSSMTATFPSRSGPAMELDAVAAALSERLVDLFRRDPATGRRPFLGGNSLFQTDPLWKDRLLFYEYFHGDNGAGIGASHQTGWTALVAQLIHDLPRRSGRR